jgi:hypothetical protein
MFFLLLFSCKLLKILIYYLMILFFQAVNRTLGCLCETFPDKMSSHSVSIKHMLISQLEEQTSSKTSKLDLTVVEGCFQGLSGCLQVHFTFRFAILNKTFKLDQSFKEVGLMIPINDSRIIDMIYSISIFFILSHGHV